MKFSQTTVIFTQGVNLQHKIIICLLASTVCLTALLEIIKILTALFESINPNKSCSVAHVHGQYNHLLISYIIMSAYILKGNFGTSTKCVDYAGVL